MRDIVNTAEHLESTKANITRDVNNFDDIRTANFMSEQFRDYCCGEWRSRASLGRAHILR
jgi:hypothetical protein